MTVTSSSATTSPTTSSGTMSLEDALQLFGDINGASTGSNGVPNQVYMGTKNVKGTKLTPEQLAALPPSAQEQALNNGAVIQQKNIMNTSEAEQQYFKWNAKQRRDFLAKGLLSGLLTQGAGDLEASQLWTKLVDQAAYYTAQGATVSPLDILNGYVSSNSTNGWIRSGDFETNPVTGEKRYIGPRFKTTTQNSVDFTDPETAKALATGVFQDLLHRDPGTGELAQFGQALAQAEQNNPQVTTTTTQYDDQGNAIGSTSTSAGGLTDSARQQIEEDRIKAGKEYGAVQAATTYQNAFDQAVYGGPS